MKTKIFIISILLILLGCNGKAEEKKVIMADNREYLSLDRVDSPAELIEEQGGKNVIDQLNEEIKKSDAYLETMRADDEKRYQYRLLVNEAGDVETVIILDSMGKTLDGIMMKSLFTWKFAPAEKDGKKVKFKYDWTYTDSEYYTDVDTRAKPLVPLQVVYPKEAKKAKIEGRVVLKAYVDENGKVVKVEILNSVNEILDEAARKAVEETKFEPALLKGRSVKSKIVMTIVFKLQ